MRVIYYDEKYLKSVEIPEKSSIFMRFNKNVLNVTNEIYSWKDFWCKHNRDNIETDV